MDASCDFQSWGWRTLTGGATNVCSIAAVNRLITGRFLRHGPCIVWAPGILISLKWELALPVSEYTAIVCRPFAQCDASLKPRGPYRFSA
jgi:hypothetical protein